jgi:polysaccharide export outer membrane protein
MIMNKTRILIWSWTLLLACLVLGGCETDPTPLVAETPPSSSLQLAPGDARQARGITAERDYRLGPNDRARITVFGQPNLTGEYVLDGGGSVAFPLIGNIDANGLTTRELQLLIAGKLSPEFLLNPNVSVEVITRRPFYVLGEVQKPGDYAYVNGITTLNAIAMAGGFTYRARTAKFYIKRLDDSGKMVRVVAKPETTVRPGDTVEVATRYF